MALNAPRRRDLGLAVADVPDDKPVHRHGALHVGLDLRGRPQLIDRLLVRERRLHLGLPGRVGREPVPVGVRPGRIQSQELLRELGDGPADPLLGAQPLGAPELAQRRPLAAGVARDPADLLDRHEDPVTAGERQLEVVALLARPAAPQHLLVPRDAMIDVDDEIARRQPFEDVARHDPPQGLRSANADRAEELAVGDEGDAVRAATEPAVQAPADERDRTGRRRLLKSIDHGDAVPGLIEDLGQAGCLVRREDDPGAVLPPGFDRIRQPAGAAERQRRLPPAEQVAGAAGAGGHRDVRGRFRLPGQLEGPRRDQAALPVARRQVGQRPVLRQLPGLDQLGSALVRLAPEEPGRLGDIARLVEDEDRSRIEVVEAGRRSEVGGPNLGRVAHRKRPRRIGVRSVGPQRVVGRALEPRQVGREPLGQTGRGAAETVADRGGARRRQEELRRGEEHRPLDPAGRPLVGRIEGAERVDLVAEELDPDRQLHRRREHIDDAAATRELAPAGDLGDRAIAEVEEVAQERVLMESRSDPELARLVGQVLRVDRVLEECLHARHQDTRLPVPPGSQRRDPRRGLVGHELTPFVGEGSPRLQDGDRRRIADPGLQLLGDPVADLRVAGDPDDAFVDRQRGCQVRLRTVRDGDDARVTADPPDIGRRPEPLPERGERAGRGEEGRERREVREPVSRSWAVVRSAGLRLRSRRPPRLVATRSFDLGVHPGDVEIDCLVVPDGCMARGEVGSDLLCDPPVPSASTAEGRSRRLRHRSLGRGPGGRDANPSSSGGCPSRPAGRRSRRAAPGGSGRPRGAGTC